MTEKNRQIYICTSTGHFSWEDHPRYVPCSGGYRIEDSWIPLEEAPRVLYEVFLKHEAQEWVDSMVVYTAATSGNVGSVYNTSLPGGFAINGVILDDTFKESE